MAFRRFTRSRFSRGRSSFSRFRRRPMNTVRRPVRWSRGNISVGTTHAHDVDNRILLTIIPIAQLQNIESADAAGGNMAQAIRRLEIGGVRLNIHTRLMGFNNPLESAEIDEARDTNLMAVNTKVLLVSDSLVTDPVTGGVSPQALNTNWWTNTLPATSTPEPQDEDGQFPRRIHWQDAKFMDSSFAQMVPADLGETVDQIVYSPSQVQVAPSHSSFNLRLRLRLQDDECLALHFSSITPIAAGAEDNEPEVVFQATGTIWYRFVWQ